MAGTLHVTLAMSDSRAQRPTRGGAAIGSTTAIVVGNMIGTGLYTSLGFQVAEIHSIPALLLLWVIGGVVALCGALAYSEMASALPRSGGEYNFLSRIFHPLVGFVSGWISITVGFAAPGALAAMAFGTYLNRVFPAIGVFPASLALVIASTLVFLYPLRVGRRYLSAFVLLNTAVLVVLVVAAFAFSEPAVGHAAEPFDGFETGQLGPFAVCLVFVMYSYSGWNASAYVIGDVENPQRTVPRSLLLGTAAVTLLYVAVNAAFLYTTPLGELEGELEVGLIAARNIFGASGGNLMSLVICVGLVATVAAMTWAGPRVAMVMGEDYPALGFLARRSASGVPRLAVLWQGAIATLLLVTSTFESVITYTEFVLILSSFLAVAGVIVLRRRNPEPDWPYRTWGYPLTPLVFLAMSLFIMVFVLIERPVECLWGLATVAAGAVVWLVIGRPRRRDRGTSPRSS